MEIDEVTLQDAARIFEQRYNSNLNDIGLSKRAKRRLLRYGIVPPAITDVEEAQELLQIRSTYKEVLNGVMKPRNDKSKLSQKPKRHKVIS